MKALFVTTTLCLWGFLQAPALSAEVTVINTLMRGAIVGPGDIEISASPYENPAEVRSSYIGMQTSRTVYAGYKLTTASLQAPSLVKRNRTVTMIYEMGGLTITTYGRSLGEGASGDLVEVMNTDSKMKVMGVVTGPDQVTVR